MKDRFFGNYSILAFSGRFFIVTSKYEVNMHKRIFIIGAPGSGKNWLAERLSKKSGIPYYDTDDIAWKKKYTIKRTHEEKCKRVDKISKQDAWILCSGGRTYLGNTPKRAQIIIILQEHIVREAFRIFKRHLKGGPGTLKDTLKTIHGGYKKYHKPTGKIYQYYEELKQKYPEKILVLSKQGKHKYLENY